MDNLNKDVVDLVIENADFGVYSVSCDAMTNIEYVENLLNN